jgi:hypothetical protein
MTTRVYDSAVLREILFLNFYETNVFWLRTLVDRTSLTLHSFTSQILLLCWTMFRTRNRLVLDSIRPVDPDPDSKSESGSRMAKMSYKTRKKVKKYHVLNSWIFSFEG